MGFKQNYNNKSGVFSILFSIVAEISIQIILVALSVMLTEKGSVGESDVRVIVQIIRAISVCGAVIVAWLLQREHYMLHASIAVGSVAVVSTVIALLFWDIKISDIFISLIVITASYILCIFALNRHRTKNVVRKKKRFYR